MEYVASRCVGSEKYARYPNLSDGIALCRFTLNSVASRKCVSGLKRYAFLDNSSGLPQMKFQLSRIIFSLSGKVRKSEYLFFWHPVQTWHFIFKQAERHSNNNECLYFFSLYSSKDTSPLTPSFSHLPQPPSQAPPSCFPSPRPRYSVNLSSAEYRVGIKNWNAVNANERKILTSGQIWSTGTGNCREK